MTLCPSILTQLLCFGLLTLSRTVRGYDAPPRWGQASVVINDALFIYGGKSDPSGGQSYTSAPSTNELLYLSLSQPFNASSPPWSLVSGPANATKDQGPGLAWHTLSAFNTSGVLLFGGIADPNSDIVIQSRPDSAVLLDVFNRLNPTFNPQPASWAGEPIRRMHHRTATIPDGRIYLIGGVKADGSGNALSDHYLFDVNAPSFTLLSSPNGPPDIYGHASIIFPDGRLLVFGGFSQAQGRLIPFDTIWVLDTKASATANWTLLSISSSNLPSPRREFAAVLLTDGRVLIHGGSDASLLSNFDDGWILDLSQNPAIWTVVAPLTQLGARRDHFAVASGNQVIFGFGYQNNGPAPAALSIYDTASSSFVPSHTPPPLAPTGSVTPSPTLPGPTQTDAGGGSTPTGSGGVHPTATVGPGGGNGNGNGGGPGGGPGGGGGNGDEESESRNRTTAIAVGAAFGVIALLLIAGGATWYYRRRLQEQWAQGQFAPLDDDEEGRGVSPGSGLNGNAGLLPPAMMGEKGDGERIRGGLSANFSNASLPPGGPSGPWGSTAVLGALGLAGLLGINSPRNPRPLRRVRTPPERRDMLADEDTRIFNTSRQGQRAWSDYEGRKEGSTGSSWSLLSVLGGSGGGAARKGFFSREPSATTVHGATPVSEKLNPFDADEDGYVGYSRRPSNRREYSYASTLSGRSMRYVDPFADPIQEEPRDTAEQLDRDGGHDRDFSMFSNWQDTYHNHPPPLSNLHIMTPLPEVEPSQPISPLSEAPSRATLAQSDPTVSSHDYERPSSPFDGARPSSSHTSFGLHQLGSSPRPSSILDPSPNLNATLLTVAPTAPMRRSDSWWTRFSRSSFLDRHASDVSRRSVGGMPDIRDPNPPPRLNPIEENRHSGSASDRPEGSGIKASPKGASMIRGSLRRTQKGHAKSTSSLQTTNTADSAALERLGGRVDVVQRTRSRAGRYSTGSTVSSHIETDSYFDRIDGDADANELAIVYKVQTPTEITPGDTAFAAAQTAPLPASPEKTPAASLASPNTRSPIVSSADSSVKSLSSNQSGGSNPKRPPIPRPPSGRSVAARVQEYERRMSQDVEVSPSSPSSAKMREERSPKKRRPTVDYGLVPRPSLFVANPDNRASDDS